MKKAGRAIEDSKTTQSSHFSVRNQSMKPKIKKESILDSHLKSKQSSQADLDTGAADENLPGAGGSVGSAPKLNDDSQDQDGEWTTEALEKKIEKPNPIEKLNEPMP